MGRITAEIAPGMNHTSLDSNNKTTNFLCMSEVTGLGGRQKEEFLATGNCCQGGGRGKAFKQSSQRCGPSSPSRRPP